MTNHNLMPLEEYGAARVTTWEHSQNLIDFVQEQEMKFGNDKPINALEFLARKASKAQTKMGARNRIHFEAYVNSQKVGKKRVSIPLYVTVVGGKSSRDFARVVERYNKRFEALNAVLVKVYDLDEHVCYHVTYKGHGVVLHEKPWR